MFKKYLHCKRARLNSQWSHIVHWQQPERSEIFIFSGLLLSGLSLAWYKITADILMTFAGGFFAEEIEDRVAIMFVVQIEVSFVSTRRESDKPEKINISVLSGCCLLFSIR